MEHVDSGRHGRAATAAGTTTPTARTMTGAGAGSGRGELGRVVEGEAGAVAVHGDCGEEEEKVEEEEDVAADALSASTLALAVRCF